MARLRSDPVSRGFLVLLVAQGGESPLDLETRRRVFVTINRYPGLTVAGLSRTAEMDEDLVRYHLRILEKAGLARTERQEGHRRVFPLERTEAGSASPLDEQEREMLGLLRRPPILRAVVALIEQGPLNAGDLAEACGVSRSTMSHHIGTMDAEGLIEIERQGRSRVLHLKDRDRLLQLLADHPPPENLVQDFIDTWENIGF